MTKFNVGDTVRWTSSNVEKAGKVVAIVPAGKLPRDVGFKELGACSPRSHESWVVRGRRVHSEWRSYEGKKTDYWPRVSLLVTVSTTPHTLTTGDQT